MLFMSCCAAEIMSAKCVEQYGQIGAVTHCQTVCDMSCVNRMCVRTALCVVKVSVQYVRLCWCRSCVGVGSSGGCTCCSSCVLCQSCGAVLFGMLVRRSMDKSKVHKAHDFFVEEEFA